VLRRQPIPGIIHLAKAHRNGKAMAYPTKQSERALFGPRIASALRCRLRRAATLSGDLIWDYEGMLKQHPS
jgi:hypothetical protein